MKKSMFALATLCVVAAAVARGPAGPAPRAGSAFDGRRRLPRQPVQLRRRGQPASRRHHGVARRDDLDGRARRPQGRQDHGHHLDRRHRAERPVAGHRQAQLRAARQLRRHRPQARQRAVRADRQVRARGRHRAQDRPHDQPRHDHDARGDLPGGADRHRREPAGARLQDHRLHRRQRRQPEGPEGRGRDADREVGRQGRRPAHRRVLHLQRRDQALRGPGRAAQGPQERRHARRPGDHAQHVHRRPQLGALRRARQGRQGDRSTACRSPTGPKPPTWRRRSSRSAPTTP